MTFGDWTSLCALAVNLAVAVFGIAAVGRRPRATVALLGIAATYATLAMLELVWRFFDSAAPQFVGPALALSVGLAVSLNVVIVAAFLIAWPLRLGIDDAAI